MQDVALLNSGVFFFFLRQPQLHTAFLFDQRFTEYIFSLFLRAGLLLEAYFLSLKVYRSTLHVLIVFSIVLICWHFLQGGYMAS